MTAFVGYRAWSVTADGDLLSLNQNTSEVWPNKVKKLALCMKCREEGWGASQLLAGPMAYLTSSAYTPQVFQPVMQTFAGWWNRKMVEKANAEHHAPEAGCSCGIYAAKSDQSEHYHSYRAGQPVWGEVYLWGKVQDYTEGYRAEYAYPKTLSTSRAELADKIAARYGVPCAYVDEPPVPSQLDALPIFRQQALQHLVQNGPGLSSWGIGQLLGGSTSGSYGAYAKVYAQAAPPQPKKKRRWFE